MQETIKKSALLEAQIGAFLEEITPEEAVNSPKFKKWFGKSKVVTSEGLPKICLHGSPNSFREFSYEFLGTSGTSEGYGFYFTDSEKVASGYSEGGQIYKAYLRIEKPLSSTKKTLTKAALSKFIKALDPTGDNYLSNYGDVSYEGYSKVLKDAVESEYDYTDNDVDLISGIINGSGMAHSELYAILKQTTGHDGIIIGGASWGDGQSIYIVFSPNQIKSVDNNGNFSASNDIYEDTE